MGDERRRPALLRRVAGENESKSKKEDKKVTKIDVSSSVNRLVKPAYENINRHQ